MQMVTEINKICIVKAFWTIIQHKKEEKKGGGGFKI